MKLFNELKRRKVFRVAAVYAVVAWLLIQVADVVIPTFNAPQWVNQVVILLLFMGFPIAVILAWALELTPQGVALDKDGGDTAGRSARHTRRQFFLVGALAIVLAAGGFLAFITFAPASDNSAEVADASPGLIPDTLVEIDKSIAVLPFVSMSAGEEDGYFADGLTEELLNSLAQLSDLKVAARTSSFYYKGRDQDLREIGAALGVAHVLEGSVRRSGDQLRITAQLVEAENGFHLWSDTYDRNMTDIFSIQDDIATQVTNALRVELLGEEIAELQRHGTDNAEAQSLYLIAQGRLREMSRLNYDIQSDPIPAGRMRALFEEATRLDPAYADAWAGLAQAILLLSRNGLTENTGILLNSENGLEQAQVALGRARSLAPNATSTLLASALMAYREYRAGIGQTDALLNSVVGEFEQVLAQEPDNVMALEELARIHWDQENYEQSQALFGRVMELDPLSPVVLDYARSFTFLDPEEAFRRTKRAGDLYPDSNWQRDMGALEAVRGHLHHAELWWATLDNTYGAGPVHFAVTQSLGNEQSAYVRNSEYLIASGGTLGDVVRLNTEIYRGNYQAVVEEVSADIDQVLGDFSLLIPALFRLRQFDEVVRQIDLAYERRDMTLEQRIFNGRVEDPRIFFEFAHALRMAGDETRAQWVINMLQEQLDSRFDQSNYNDRRLYLEGTMMLQAIEGRTEPALDTFEALMESGWRWLVSLNINSGAGEKFSLMLFRFEDNPIFDSLRDEPRFIETLDRVKAENARMQAELDAGLTLDDIIDEVQ